MTRIAFSLILTAAAAFATEGALKLLRESHAGATRNIVFVGRAEHGEVVRKAIAKLGPQNVSFGRMLFYPDEASSRMRFRENQTSCTLQSLRSFLAENGLPVDPPRCPELSEVIKIGPSMLLRSVDRECRTSAKLIQGNMDPLVIRPLKQRAEIVDIWVGVAPRSKEAWGKEYPGIAVFVRTQGAANAELAKNILGRMQEMSGARDALVAIRNDTEFGRFCQFPQPYLFSGPPADRGSESRANRSDTLVCVSLYPYPVQCWTDHDDKP